MAYTNTGASTSISGWSGSNGRVFTLAVTAGPISGTQWKDTMKVSVNWNDSYWYDSHLYVWEWDVQNSVSYTRFNQTGSWDSGWWFTQPGTSGSWEDTWTRTDSDRTVRVYVTGYVNQYSDRSAYVQFTIPKKRTITVTFNGNGATSNTFGTQTFKEGNSNQSFVGSISRTGYSMLGWSWSSTATSASFSTNSSVADVWIWDNYGTKTLYAVWKANTYSVYYNANGGTGAPATQTKTHDVALTLQAKGSLAHANTTAVASRIVRFNANGGTVGTTSLTSTGVETRSAWTPSGWNTNSAGSGTNYAFSGTYTANSAATMYAKWTYTSSYGTFTSITLPAATRATTTSTVTRTIYYNANGGTVGTSSQSVTATKTTSYAQTGWYSSSTNGTRLGDAGGAYTPTATMTAYAHWTITYSTGTFNSVTLPTPSRAATTATVTRTIYYNPNTGSVSPASQASTATVTTTYTQTGWYSSSTNGTKFGAAGASYTPTATQTAYAHWTLSYATGTFSTVTLPTPTKSTTTATVTRTVYFNANGGTTTKTSQASTATVTTSYTQTGWYSSSTNGTKYGAAGASYTPTATMTAYAHWTIAYSTGTFSNVTLPTTAQCTRTNYTLLGFNTSSGATTATYNPGASYNGSSTMYAIWKINKLIWIWDGSTWRAAKPWIWNGSAWKEAEPWVWDGSAWK